MKRRIGSVQHSQAPALFEAALPFSRVLQPGDQVRALRGLYAHHAIYIGNRWLIEFGSGVGGGPVAWVLWDDFRRGDATEFVRAGGELAVNRAVSQLGRDDFDLISGNCEHFANWCTTGDWSSPQVQMVVTRLAVGGVLLLVSQLAKAR